MSEEADAFVMLPGGLGTFDETFEIITWRQLHLHDKPILICDVNGSAAPLLALIDAVIANGFARPTRARCMRRRTGSTRCSRASAHWRTTKGEASALL